MIMNYEIVTLNEKLTAGISIKTINEDMKSVKDIGNLWSKFIEKGIYADIPNKLNGEVVGLYTEYEGDFTKPYKFMCCCEISTENNVKNYEIKKIPSGKYAKFTIKGDKTEAVGKAWSEIWQTPLQRKYDCDFEVYYNEKDNNGNEIIDIYISLI